MIDLHDELIQPTIASFLVHILLATLVTLNQKCICLLGVVSGSANTIVKGFWKHREELVERYAKLRLRVHSADVSAGHTGSLGRRSTCSHSDHLDHWIGRRKPLQSHQLWGLCLVELAISEPHHNLVLMTDSTLLRTISGHL